MPIAAPSVRFVGWSDYLCPWCANAAVRLARLEDAYEGRVAIEWRSYLLRPRPRPASGDALEAAERREKFDRYTQRWRVPGSEPDAAELVPWDDAASDDPPSHSMPAQLVAKAAQRIDGAAFARLHAALFRAYFAERRDISAPPVLLELWERSGLAPDRFADADDPAVRDAVVADHRAALELGVTGVPALAVRDSDAVVVGAQPLDVYRRWFDRMLARAAEPAG